MSGLLAKENSEAPVAVAMREGAEQMDKLAALVDELENRLQSVRRSTPDDPRAEGTELPAAGRGRSLLATNLDGMVGSIRDLQRRMRTLLDELEV